MASFLLKDSHKDSVWILEFYVLVPSRSWWIWHNWRTDLIFHIRKSVSPVMQTTYWSFKASLSSSWKCLHSCWTIATLFLVVSLNLSSWKLKAIVIASISSKTGPSGRSASLQITSKLWLLCTFHQTERILTLQSQINDSNISSFLEI